MSNYKFYVIGNVKIMIMKYFLDYDLWDMTFYYRLIYKNVDAYKLWYIIPLYINAK